MRTKQVSLYTLLFVSGCDVIESVKIEDTADRSTTTRETESSTTSTTILSIEASYDLMIKEGDPTGNYEYWPIALGSDYDGAEQGLFYFDVANYAGRRVNFAAMMLYALSPVCHSATTGTCTNNDGTPLSITIRSYEITSTWIENALNLTWETKPTYDESQLLSMNIINHTQEDLDAHGGTVSYTFPIDAGIVQNWIDNRTNYGILLRAPNAEERGGNNQLDFIVGTRDGKNTVRRPAELNVEVY